MWMGLEWMFFQARLEPQLSLRGRCCLKFRLGRFTTFSVEDSCPSKPFNPSALNYPTIPALRHLKPFIPPQQSHSLPSPHHSPQPSQPTFPFFLLTQNPQLRQHVCLRTTRYRPHSRERVVRAKHSRRDRENVSYAGGGRME